MAVIFKFYPRRPLIRRWACRTHNCRLAPAKFQIISHNLFSAHTHKIKTTHNTCTVQYRLTIKSVSTNTATANQSKESHSPNHSDEGLPSPPALVMLSSPRKSRRARFRRYHALGSDRISDSRRMSYLKDALPMSQMAGEKMAESPVYWNVPSALQGHRKGAFKNKIFDLKGFWVCFFACFFSYFSLSYTLI